MKGLKQHNAKKSGKLRVSIFKKQILEIFYKNLRYFMKFLENFEET